MFIKSRTASFDVDPQKTFTPVCPNELPVPDGDMIVPALNMQATLARVRVGSKDAHSPAADWVSSAEHPQFSAVGKQDVDIRWNLHAVPGTQGFEFLDGLPQPRDYDYMVWKGVEPDMHPYGACYHNLDWKNGKRLSTGVIEYLKCEDIEHVIVGGLATDYCVLNTALQLRDAGFEVTLNLAACRGIAPESINAAIATMTSQGIRVVDDVVRSGLVYDDSEPAMSM